ncbi:MAG TPA: GyrI-like domain-containing protein [Phototrophicaceae bacterium]|nr:GyrI-like domain-containing protein [Phototrophicaceae bacterium]
MEPVITTITEKKLVGKRVIMSFAENKTPHLWRSFIPHRKDIKNTVSNEMISMSTYSEPLRLGDFNQNFYKWAVVEVSDFDNVPEEMETFVLKGGLYAVFHYQGIKY